MDEIVRCSRRYVLCGEYRADDARGSALPRRRRARCSAHDYGRLYQERFPRAASCVEEGFLARADGVWDDMTYWVFDEVRDRHRRLRHGQRALGAERVREYGSCRRSWSAEPAEVLAAERVVIPGVGAFRDAIARLRERGPGAGAARRRRRAGRPLLGVCLGMQLLATRSIEFGSHEGLDLIPGSVELLRTEPGAADPARRLERPRACGGPTIRCSARSGPSRPSTTCTPTSSCPTTRRPSPGVTDYGRPVTACVGVGQRVRRAVPSREERPRRPRAAERLRRVLKTRLIPCLLLQNGLLVRSEEFRTHQVIGQPDPPGRALQRVGGRRADLPRHHPRGRARRAPRRPQGQGQRGPAGDRRGDLAQLLRAADLRRRHPHARGHPAADRPRRRQGDDQHAGGRGAGVHRRGRRRRSAARRSSSRSTRAREPRAAGR